MASHTRGPGDSGSKDKLTLYGSIGTALIGAAAVIIVGVMNHPNVSTVSTTAPSPKSDLVSFNKLQMNGTGRVTVSGLAEKDVNDAAVVVAIGPKPSGGYWFGYGSVLNQHWQADVATDPPWQNYAISAAYYYGLPGGASPAPGAPAPPEPNATSEPAVPAVAPAGRLVSETTRQSALKFAFQTDPPTPPPPPPPDQLVNCVEQFGPSCFTGPGFGPPSVYQPKQ
jgi:hypothetical protein